MAKTKKIETTPEVTPEVEPVEPEVDETQDTRVHLEARREFLLGLLNTLESEKFNDKGNVEIALSNVNREISTLK